MATEEFTVSMMWLGPTSMLVSGGKLAPLATRFIPSKFTVVAGAGAVGTGTGVDGSVGATAPGRSGNIVGRALISRSGLSNGWRGTRGRSRTSPSNDPARVTSD